MDFYESGRTDSDLKAKSEPHSLPTDFHAPSHEKWGKWGKSGVCREAFRPAYEKPHLCGCPCKPWTNLAYPWFARG